MKQLKRITLVQFYLHEAVDIEIDGATAFLGPNGSGKSSTLDAIQIAMLGGNQQYTRFNSQSVSTKQKRSLTSYCLGMLRNPDKDSDIIGRARDEARTYIILVFQDEKGNETISAGICIEADASTNEHEIKGLFVLPGQDLKANDCIVYDGNERRPISFAEFRELAREQAKKIGRTPT
ncbi:ATP-binding protein, partial [Vibrio paracholerae]|uniref:ATP-binding protein n=1 Tax=Vibrio paracholerae TaxID=650003 RepID=UPI00050D045B